MALMPPSASCRRTATSASLRAADQLGGPLLGRLARQHLLGQRIVGESLAFQIHAQRVGQQRGFQVVVDRAPRRTAPA